ncbi:MAG: MMPL family transporter, partial [Nocardioides sp.]|nr:MMPL family transporter [Nocardioides sp.]
SGTAAVAGGAGRLSDAVAQLRTGLGQASAYLRRTSTQAKGPVAGGFYLPPSALQDERLAAVSGVYVSRDGHTARLVVIGRGNPFSNAAVARSADIVRAAREGLRGTTLQHSSVASTGFSSIYRDIADLQRSDFEMIAAATLLAVAVILMLLTRSVVAAGLLLVAVALSYATAMGLGVLVWQVVLDKPLEWGVPAIAFVLLVSVGADYNLLLIKRVHEEAPDGDRGGLARAVSASGRVIAAAGLIFAASMFSLLSGEVRVLGQLGFVVGSGLLIDTFVVRTLVVPAVAAMLGRNLWWPGLGRRGSAPGSGAGRRHDAVVVGVDDRSGAVT